MTERKIEGWFWLLNSRKLHFFVDGISLCRRWMLMGGRPEENQTLGSHPGPDDCAACWKKAKARA